MMKDLVVIGGGHAGCEAALAGARMGLDTLLLTLNMDGIALMACNPVIGGSAKGHLVRELDAMGGEMGRAIDDTFLQSRMLNMSKGPAVHALRAQADKQQYQNRMRTALMTQDNLTVRQGEVAAIDVENGHDHRRNDNDGAAISCKVAVVCVRRVPPQPDYHRGEHHAGRAAGADERAEPQRQLDAHRLSAPPLQDGDARAHRRADD